MALQMQKKVYIPLKKEYGNIKTRREKSIRELKTTRQEKRASVLDARRNLPEIPKNIPAPRAKTSAEERMEKLRKWKEEKEKKVAEVVLKSRPPFNRFTQVKHTGASPYRLQPPKFLKKNKERKPGILSPRVPMPRRAEFTFRMKPSAKPEDEKNSKAKPVQTQTKQTALRPNVPSGGTRLKTIPHQKLLTIQETSAPAGRANPKPTPPQTSAPAGRGKPKPTPPQTSAPAGRKKLTPPQTVHSVLRSNVAVSRPKPVVDKKVPTRIQPSRQSKVPSDPNLGRKPLPRGKENPKPVKKPTLK